MTRVGIDASLISVRGKGVARYLAELPPRLAALDDGPDVVALADPTVGLPAGAEHLERHPIRPRPAAVWEQVRLPLSARTARLDLLHTTSDRLPLLSPVPVVLYLFEDPRHREALAAATGRSVRHRISGALTTSLYPSSLRRAALILVSSHATARDVTARGVDPQRVVVVYPGVSPAFRPARDDAERDAARANVGAPDGYVLHFSSDDPRDNTPVALRAYAEARRRRPELPPLLVAGPVEATLPEQQRLAGALGLDDVRWLGYCSSDRLLDAYRGASAYLDPSLFEGFGFQVAEALASGVPTVCSNTTSLPEVVGDAGLLVAPHDVDGFAAGLLHALDDPGLRERGPLQAAQFSWERTAAETVAAWRQVLA